MALLTQKNVGGVTVTPGVANLNGVIIMEDYAAVTPNLSTVGLPRIQVYVQTIKNSYNGSIITPPSSALTLQVQLALSTKNGEPYFLNYDFLQIPNQTPVTFSYEQPCLAARLYFRTSPYEPTEGYRIDYNLSAFGP